MQKSSAFPWHALLFALFPVISLLANNVGQVDYSVAYRPLTLSLVVSAAILAEPDFYPSLTPVNNFRLVFNSYFNTSLPVLPDKSFYVDINHPYVFDEMNDPCTPSQ